MASKMKRSRDKVFHDVGFAAEDAASLRIRADLMIRIRQLIERLGLTQAAAARILGVRQPRVSDLVRGKIDLFSIDTLVDMLARAGVRVRLTVQSSPRKRRPREAT